MVGSGGQRLGPNPFRSLLLPLEPPEELLPALEGSHERCAKRSDSPSRRRKDQTPRFVPTDPRECQPPLYTSLCILIFFRRFLTLLYHPLVFQWGPCCHPSLSTSLPHCRVTVFLRFGTFILCISLSILSPVLEEENAERQKRSSPM